MKIWCNGADTKRERPVQRDDGRWSYDAWYRHRIGGWAQAVVSGEGFDTEEKAIEWICHFIDFGNDEDVRVLEVAHPTEGWPEAKQWEAPEGAPEIEVGQVWERGGRAAIVLGYAPHPMTGELAVYVRYANPNPGVGSSMHRKPSAHWYSEQRFRKLYKP